MALNEVIERAIHWVRKGTAPAFTVHWTPGPPLTVLGSSGQLMQVMVNLIQNAYDAASTASAPGARSDGSPPALWISASTQGKAVKLRLRDNGPGIPEAHLSRLFDPFFTTKPVGKGAGLGLSISYGIVEQHGGKLTAGNAVEGGAEFWVELVGVG